MGMRRVSPLVAAGAALVAVTVVGALVAWALDGVLAVSFQAKTPLPEIPPEAAAPVAVTPLNVPPTVHLTGPAGDPLLDAAAAALGDSLSGRSGTPAVVTGGTGPDPDAGDGPTVTAVLTPDEDLGQGYRIDGDGERAVVTGSDRRGLAAGLFALADRVAGGADWAPLVTGSRTVAPALQRRFVEAGAVGVQPDEAAYAAQDDYQHTSGALAEVVLPQEPWVDAEALERVRADWQQFVDHAVAYGYNGVIVKGFLEYVAFSGVGDGTEVYPPGSTEAARAPVMRREVGRMWSYADDMGLDIVLSTDMLALSTPLEAYVERTLGGLDASDPRLWQLYQAALDELLTEMPYIDGLMIRIGEAGGIYNSAGWDYYSKLAVTDAAGVRAMLTALTPTAAAHGATVYYRTWSVGVGDIGDIHTNPDTYQRVLSDLPAEVRDNLVVSTKFVRGDFDSYLPVNPTLLGGDEQRMVEMQARREFEGFSSFPNLLAPLHQSALRTVRAANPNVSGIWTWTQDGGPWRAGPLSLYLKTGQWKLADLDVYAAARLAWDPDADLAEVTRTWISRMWTDDPASVAALQRVLGLSRSAVLDGLYIRPYAEQDVRAFGLEPPPMLWIFKWDIVGGDSAALSAVYAASRGRVDEAVAEGYGAADTVQAMSAAMAGADRATFADPADHDYLVAAIDYEYDLLLTLATFREAVLRHYEWVDTGSGSAQAQFRDALARFEEARDTHVSRYSGDLDLPPYQFFAADAGLQLADRSAAMAWVARGLLVMVVVGLVVLRPLRGAVLTPWRAGALLRGVHWWQVIGVFGVPVIALIGSRLAVSGFAAPSYAVSTLGWWALAAAGVWAAARLLRADVPGVLAVLAGAVLVRAVILLAALSVRGPGWYWYGFWISPERRGVYVTIATAAALWVVVAVATALRSGSGLTRAGTVGGVLTGVGVPLLGLGAVAAALGMERSITRLNDELAVVPLGLSRILGLTVHLGIPTAVPYWLLGAGGVALAVGLGLVAAGRGRTRMA